MFSLLISTLAMAKVTTKVVEYTQGGVSFRGYLAVDDAISGERPGVLVCPEWWGLNDYAKRRAEQIAQMGYVAFVMDPYGGGKVVETREQAQELAGSLYAPDDQTGRRELMRARAKAALQTLSDQPQTDKARLASIGFCMGGTVSLELARAAAEGDHLRAVVSFHGGLSTPVVADAENIRASILVCHGAVDPFVPAKEVEAFKQEMENASADYQFIAYSGAVHSFTNPAATGEIVGAKHDENAERRSWALMTAFLKERFGPDGKQGGEKLKDSKPGQSQPDQSKPIR